MRNKYRLTLENDNICIYASQIKKSIMPSQSVVYEIIIKINRRQLFSTLVDHIT